jgi:hypothetical protein
VCVDKVPLDQACTTHTFPFKLLRNFRIRIKKLKLLVCRAE